MTTERFINHNEAARLNALRDLKLLDTPPSESFDRLTRMASRLLGAPVSTISLTDGDRQWFKSKVGVDLAEIPREQAPCAYAIKASEVFVVPDLLEDDRFRTSPLAQAGIRCYAGAPLITRSGFGLGTICVVDDAPRQFGPDEQRTLLDLAGMVMAQIEVQNMIGRVDGTTGYPNQHQFFEDLVDLASRCPGQPATAAVVEILGPAETAHALRVLGTAHADGLVRRALQVLQRAAGNRGRVYHLNQMRCAVLSDADGVDGTALADRILKALAEPVVCEGIPIALAPAIGHCEITAGEIAPEDILRRLLSATDGARDAGVRQAHYSLARDESEARRYALVNDFATALTAEDQLRLVYQPRVDLATGQVVGVEALLRWHHPTLGPVSPGEFIPLVEQTALVRPMTRWVIKAAARQALAWQRSGFHLRVSLNASARNLDEPDFAVGFLDVAQAIGLDPHGLELEFTESATARDQSNVVTQLRALHAAGVVIAIDDFGTGYSNLAYIQKLPISVLKIDRSFVSDLLSSDTNCKLVRSMTAMARDLGYSVVAEGVETKEVYDMLAEFGCDEGQGYFMAKPMSPAEIQTFVTSRRTRKAA